MISSEVTSSSLLNLNRFEQTFEISCTESLMIVSLNDFKEQSRSVLNRFSEDLQKITLIVIIYENFKLLKGFNVLVNLYASMLQAFTKSLIIGIRNCQELDSSIFQCRDSLNNIWSRKCYVLNTSTTVVINVLLDLRLPLSISRFINRHLYSFVKISDDN